jgi:AcrR family transcriptional regulator
MKHDMISNRARERIIVAAKKEFSRKGFGGARMSVIAGRASVNKALIYYYFKGKDALYLEVLKRIFSGTGAAAHIPEVVGRWVLTPSQKLYICIYFIVNIFLRATDPDALRIIFWEIAEGRRNLDSLMMEYNVPRQKVLEGVVREGIDKKEFETRYPLLSVMNIISFITLYLINKQIYNGRSVFLEIYGSVDEKDVFEFILELAYKSLKPRDKRLEIPDLPGDLKILLEELLAMLIEKKDEGANEEVFKRVEQILKS